MKIFLNMLCFSILFCLSLIAMARPIHLSSPRHFLLKGTYEVRQVNGHCICVLGVSILPLLTILLLDFGTVPTVWFFCFFLFIHKRNPQHSVANCLPLDWSEIKCHHYGDDRRRKKRLKTIFVFIEITIC